MWRPDSPDRVKYYQEDMELKERGLDDTLYSLEKICCPANSPESCINIDEFDDVYSKEEIKKDKELVEKYKSQQEHERGRVGIFMENMITSSDNLKLFGNMDIAAKKTTDIDDYKNHIDVIAEVKQNINLDLPAISRFGIDVTTADRLKAEEKIRKIDENLKKGELGMIKYFKSEYTLTKKRLNNVPIFILRTDREDIYSFLSRIKPAINGKNMNISDKALYRTSFDKFGKILHESLYKESLRQVRVLTELLKEKDAITEDEINQINNSLEQNNYKNIFYLLHKKITINKKGENEKYLHILEDFITIFGTIKNSFSVR